MLGVFYTDFYWHKKLDWVVQTLINFKCQLSLKCKLISWPFQVILSVN
jgi:hypothetical protein